MKDQGIAAALAQEAERFGLVKPAPEFLVWIRSDGWAAWHAIAGADSAGEAWRLAALHGGVVARRGQRPEDVVSRAG